MRYVAFTLVVGLSLGLFSTAAPAADLKWQVSPGFGGVVRSGAWTPYFVTFSNEGGARTGRVVANVTVPQVNNLTLPYVTEVELPQHSKKRYTVYAPSPEVDSLRLELSGFRAEERTFHTQEAKAGDLVVCVVGGDGGFLSFLNGAGVWDWRRRSPNGSPYADPVGTDGEGGAGGGGGGRTPRVVGASGGVARVGRGERGGAGGQQPVGGQPGRPGGAAHLGGVRGDAARAGRRAGAAFASGPLASLLPRDGDGHDQRAGPVGLEQLGGASAGISVRLARADEPGGGGGSSLRGTRAQPLVTIAIRRHGPRADDQL